jgi:nucleoside-diphosphate-sugar epimerase
MRYLVTGGFGFVGSNLVEELTRHGHDITVLDNLSNGQINNLKHIKDAITAYISNVEQLQTSHFSDEFDGIFHLATAPRSSSLTDPIRDIETNCKGMIAVLEFARKNNAKIVFTSNSGIYGTTENGRSINEKSVNNPTTPYDANKFVSEWYCKIYHEIYGVSSTILRLATVYGERQKVNEKLNWRPLVATFVKNILDDEDVVINGDGEQTRDLIYVKDVVQGLIKAMESSANDADIFLLSTDQETSVNQVLRIVEQIAKKTAIQKHSESLKGDIRRMRYDYSKAKKILNFEPKFTIHDGIKQFFEAEKDYRTKS